MGFSPERFHGRTLQVNLMLQEQIVFINIFIYLTL